MDQQQLIIDTLDKIRPYINRDGGDVEFVSFNEGVVKVRMLGACIGCHALDDTLYYGIESLLKEEVPGVLSVELEEVTTGLTF